MIMNAEDHVGNIRNLLLNIESNPNNSAKYLHIDENDNVEQKEMSPSKMVAFLAKNYDNEDELFISFYPYHSSLSITIHTFKR